MDRMAIDICNGNAHLSSNHYILRLLPYVG
jgi:hypothetical protein